MSGWNRIVQEEVRAEHRQQVLQAASPLLARNRTDVIATGGRRYVLAGLVSSLAAAAAAIFVVFRPSERDKPSEERVSSDFLAMAPAMEMDLDLLEDLDMFEDLEVLEKWEPS